MSKSVPWTQAAPLRIGAAALSLALGALSQAGVAAQQPPAAAAAAPATAQAQAPIDLTGYWVPVVTEDWRFRMLTAPKGDYGGVPLSPDGRKLAELWDRSQDGSCLAYGAAGLMRLLLRVHITWDSDSALKLE